MIKINDFLKNKIKDIPLEEFEDITYLRDYAFMDISSVENVYLPATLNAVTTIAFSSCLCTNMKLHFHADTSPEIQIGSDVGPYNPNDEGVYWLIANGRVLLPSKVNTTQFQIPNTVTNLSSYSLVSYGTSSDTRTKVVIPDSIEIVQSYLFGNTAPTTLTTLVIGSSVKQIGGNFLNHDQPATMIFRQPAGMHVELPIPGDKLADSINALQAPGMCYNKTSRAFTIYTDNECIKNYDWAKDNVTPTFYPLSAAPTT